MKHIHKFAICATVTWALVFGIAAFFATSVSLEGGSISGIFLIVSVFIVCSAGMGVFSSKSYQNSLEKDFFEDLKFRNIERIAREARMVANDANIKALLEYRLEASKGLNKTTIH